MFSQLVLFYIIGPADGIVWLRKIMISGYRADTALHWDCDCVWRGSVPRLSTSSSSSDSSFLLAISAWKFVVDDILNKKYCICEKKKHGRNSWMSDKLCGCRVSHQLNYILPFLTFCWLDVITFLMRSFFFYWIVFQRRGWNRRERKGREREEGDMQQIKVNKTPWMLWKRNKPAVLSVSLWLWVYRLHEDKIHNKGFI